jgi:phosphomannomutase
VIKPSALFLYTTSIKIGSLDYNVPQLALEESMTADRVEVSWDPGKSKWLVRMQSGEEVIRRYCDAPKSADEQTLRAAAEKTVRDEGYQPNPAGITIRREQAANRQAT